MGICSKTCIVPQIYPDYLTSKTPSLNFHGHIVTIHNHDFHDPPSLLPAITHPEPTCTGGRGFGCEQNAGESNVSVLKILCGLFCLTFPTICRPTPLFKLPILTICGLFEETNA